jgi:hypothetical protein
LIHSLLYGGGGEKEKAVEKGKREEKGREIGSGSQGKIMASDQTWI